MAINPDTQRYIHINSGELLIDYVNRTLENLQPFKITGTIDFELNLYGNAGNIKFSAKPFKFKKEK